MNNRQTPPEKRDADIRLKSTFYVPFIGSCECRAFGNGTVTRDSKTSADVEFKLKGDPTNGIHCLAAYVNGSVRLTDIDKKQNKATMNVDVDMGGYSQEKLSQQVPFTKTKSDNATNIHSQFVSSKVGIPTEHVLDIKMEKNNGPANK